MKLKRGLTLLEVLIAAALLAVMAAACVPAMAQAMRALHVAETPTLAVDPVDLASFADLVLEWPELFGFKQPEELLNADGQALPWPPPPEPPPRPEAFRDPLNAAPPVTIRVLRSSGEESDHVWLSFECDGLIVHRWMAIPEVKEQPQP
jgi:prepilin-type N-terminal cleavage/methylation domain-containing protein